MHSELTEISSAVRGGRCLRIMSVRVVSKARLPMHVRRSLSVYSESGGPEDLSDGWVKTWSRRSIF